MPACAHQACSLLFGCSCEVDEDHEAYKRFKLIQRASEWEDTGQNVDSDTLAQPEDQSDALGIKQACTATGCIVHQ